jgi:hypothetical protein
MDLRFAAFVRISRDARLRSLLVNYADRLDHDRTGIGEASETCFVALRWAPARRECAPTGSQLLTARVHMPRHRAAEHLYLDSVLQRVRAALSTDSAEEPITARWLGTSCTVLDCGADTISKASTFEIAPATRRRTRPTAIRRLQPWTGSPCRANAPSLN